MGLAKIEAMRKTLGSPKAMGKALLKGTKFVRNLLTTDYNSRAKIGLEKLIALK